MSRTDQDDDRAPEQPRRPWACIADNDDGQPCREPVCEGSYCETHSAGRRLLSTMHRLLGYRSNGAER